MKKNYLIINGSPRKNGNIAKMLNAAAEELEKAGNEITRFNVNEMKLSPCTGCMKCRSTGSCILPKDDAHWLSEAVRTCSGIVMGTPVYWGNMSGQMKLVFDRIVPVLMAESPAGLPKALHRGKKAIIVTACTTIWPFNILAGESTGALRAMREILSYAGFRIVGKAVLPGTKKKNVNLTCLLLKIKRLARQL